MEISRRGFLKGVTASAVVPGTALLQGCMVNVEGVFEHGVASGDPLQDRVILWTRISIPKNVKYTSGQIINVHWEMSEDERFLSIARNGTTTTSDAVDFTVKVDADGLSDNTRYYYRFKVEDVVSPVGRTKTLPEGDVEQLNIAFTSCSHYMFGYFNVYSRIADIDDLDAVLHLGDYIYEYGNKDLYRNPFLLDRKHEPDHEMVTLADYRTRHAQYKRDSDARYLHAKHPMICVWDDHEFTDNAWKGGARNHNPEKGEGDWGDRSRAAIQSYYEWMPIREPENSAHRTSRDQLYRTFRFGNLIEMIMLDTRYVGRDEQVKLDGTERDENRSLLGFEQEQWLESSLVKAQQDGITWKMLGQQVQMMQLRAFGQYVNSDSWDGYQAARNRLLDFVEQKEIDNLVILTGDIHSSWAAEICKNPYDPKQYNFITGEGAKAVEFVTPSVTSPSIPVPGLQQVVGDAGKLLRLENQHIRYIDFKSRGFVLLRANKEKVVAEWLHVPVVGLRNDNVYLDRTFTVYAGESKLHEGF